MYLHIRAYYTNLDPFYCIAKGLLWNGCRFADLITFAFMVQMPIRKVILVNGDPFSNLVMCKIVQFFV